MGTGTQTANGNGFLIECTIKCEMHFTARKQTTRIKGRKKKKTREINKNSPEVEFSATHIILKRIRSYISYIYIFYICFLFLQLSEIVAIEMKLAVRYYCKLSDAAERCFASPPFPFPIHDPAPFPPPWNIFNLHQKLRFICFGQHIESQFISL